LTLLEKQTRETGMKKEMKMMKKKEEK